MALVVVDRETRTWPAGRRETVASIGSMLPLGMISPRRFPGVVHARLVGFSVSVAAVARGVNPDLLHERKCVA